MPTVFIANMAVKLPSRFAEGDIATETAAGLLNEIQVNRVRAQLRHAFERGKLAPEELQGKADELMAQPLRPGTTTDDDPETDDPIMHEALSIARELIVSRMAAEGLPPPKGIDTHAKQLVDNMSEIYDKARLRLEARHRAAAEALEALT